MKIACAKLNRARIMLTLFKHSDISKGKKINMAAGHPVRPR